MREMKDSGVEWIGAIPHSWKVVRNKGLIFEVNERCEADTDLPLLSVSEYYGIAPKSEKIADGDFITRSESLKDYKICHVNDVVMNIMLAWKRAQGVSNFNGIVSPAYCVYRKKENAPINMAYYHYLIRSDLYISVFKRYSTGIIDSRLRLYPDKFLALYSHVPPLNEQKKIAAHLERKCTQIDALISNAQQQIEKLKAYKQSVITETVTKGLDPDVAMKDSGVEWIGEIPKHWREIKMKYVMYIRARLGWKGLKADEYVDNGYTFIGTPNIDENGNIDWDNVYYITKERYEESPEIMLSQGDVLLTKDGAGIGKCAYIDRLPTEATTNGSLAVITCNNRLEGKYLFYYLKSIYFQKYIDRLKAGMGVPHLFQGDLKEIVIPLPSIEDQNSIIEILDRKCSQIDKLITIKQQKIEKLQQYKKSLIYEYVTGKKEVI